MKENKYKRETQAGKAGQGNSEGDTHGTQILEALADSSDHRLVGDVMDRYQSCEKPESQSPRAISGRWFQKSLKSTPVLGKTEMPVLGLWQ